MTAPEKHGQRRWKFADTHVKRCQEFHEKSIFETRGWCGVIHRMLLGLAWFLWLRLCLFPSSDFQSLGLGLVRPLCRPWKPEMNRGTLEPAGFQSWVWEDTHQKMCTSMYFTNRDELNRHGVLCSGVSKSTLLVFVDLRPVGPLHSLNTTSLQIAGPGDLALGEKKIPWKSRNLCAIYLK